MLCIVGVERGSPSRAATGGAAFNCPIGVVYNGGTIAGCTTNRWLIRSESGLDRSAGIKFNVLVITR